MAKFMIEVDGNKKHYFSTISKKETDSFLLKAVELKVVLQVWEKGQDEDDLEEFEVTSYHPESATLLLELKGGFFSKLSGSKLTGKEIFFKMNFQKIHLFSYATLEVHSSTGGHQIKATNIFYKSQQRSNYRLATNKHFPIQFKMNDEVYKGLDISAGGTSIIAPKDRYQQGDICQNCVIRIAKINFPIAKAKIMAVTPLKDPFGREKNEAQIGIAFIEVLEKIEEELFKSINSEARAEEMRKSLLEKKK